jgi:hypothetical protein
MTITDPPQPFRPVLRRVIADPADYLDDLLMYIEEGRVIPIIGPELVQVEHEGRQVPLYDFVARRLAEQFNLVERLPAAFTLQDVIAVYTQDGRQPIEKIYPRILSILNAQELSTPPALARLARILPFRLFVTTTFDSLLTRAVNEARFGGAEKTREIVYTGTRARADLDPEWEAGGDPIVFHLLGRASSAPNYVATEEDTLEFLYKLQADAPHMRLFDELTSKHLLILGCSFPDWLARFFIRLAKRVQLSARRSEMELLADSRSPGDGSLALFLDNFSYSTRLFPVGAAEFVDLLAERWEARYGAAAPPAPVPPAPAADAAPMADGALMISYVREDQAAAERLCEALGRVTDVWLDLRELEAGDIWDPEIRRTVNRCSLFVPLLSRNAAGQLEGYFRREWNMAVSRREGMAAELPFIVPVLIDDLPHGAGGVPPAFWDAQAARLPGGQATPEFLTQVVEKVRRVRAAMRG